MFDVDDNKKARNMDLLWGMSVTLFTMGMVAMMMFIKSKENAIQRWRLLRHHRLERENYIRVHGDELMDALTKHQLTIYIDGELDDAHARAEEQYARANMDYLWYQEKSYQQARLHGHTMPFNDHFVQLLIRQYCLPRWWLISQLCKQGSTLIVPYLYQLMQPHIDLETRRRQRALMKERDDSTKMLQ